jgi:lactoylglutathione lyase
MRHDMPTTRLNLVVIRTLDLVGASAFYGAIGLKLKRHSHGKGPSHLTHEGDDIVFEVYPHEQEGPNPSARIGFAVDDVDAIVKRVVEIGAVVRQQAKDSPWGRRAVVEDFDGNIVELTSV